MDYPEWLLPRLAELDGTPRDPHIMYDEPDEVELEKLRRMRERRKSKEDICLQINELNG